MPHRSGGGSSGTILDKEGRKSYARGLSSRLVGAPPRRDGDVAAASSRSSRRGRRSYPSREGFLSQSRKDRQEKNARHRPFSSFAISPALRDKSQRRTRPPSSFASSRLRVRKDRVETDPPLPLRSWRLCERNLVAANFVGLRLRLANHSRPFAVPPLYAVSPWPYRYPHLRESLGRRFRVSPGTGSRYSRQLFVSCFFNLRPSASSAVIRFSG